MFFPDVVSFVRDELWRPRPESMGEGIVEDLSRVHGVWPLNQDQWWESTGLWLRALDAVVIEQLDDVAVVVEDVLHHGEGGFLVSRVQADLGSDRAGTGPGCVLLAVLRHTEEVAPGAGSTMTGLSWQSEAFLLDADGAGYLTGRRAVALAMTVHSIYATKVRVENVRAQMSSWSLR